MDELPDDAIFEIMTRLDPSSRLLLGLSSRRLLLVLARSRPRLALAPTEEAAYDEALDPGKFSPGFVSHCIRNSYINILRFLHEEIKGTSLSVILQSSSPKLRAAAACCSFPTLLYLESQGLDLLSVAPELASKHGRPLFEHLLAREDFPEWFLNSQLAQERRKRIILALFKLEDEDLLIEFFKVLSKVEKNPSQLARNSTAFWAVGCIGQRRWFDFLEAKLEADWGSIVLHLGPQSLILLASAHDGRLQIIQGAARGGHADLLFEFMGTDETTLISAFSRSFALEDAAVGGHTHILEALREDGSTATSLLGSAGFAGQLQVWKWLSSRYEEHISHEEAAKRYMNGVISDGPNRLRFFADDDAQCQALREAFKFCNELGIQPPKMLRMAVMTRAGFPSLAFLAQQELPHLFSSELVTLAAGSDDLSTLRFLVKQNYPVDPWEAFERSFRTFLMGCVDWIFHRFRPQLLEQLTPSRIDTLISFPPGRVLRSLGWLLKNGIPLAGTRAHYHVFSEARHDGVPALFRECLEKLDVAQVPFPLEDKRAVYRTFAPKLRSADEIRTLLLERTSHEEAVELGLIPAEGTWPPTGLEGFDRCLESMQKQTGEPAVSAFPDFSSFVTF